MRILFLTLMKILSVNDENIYMDLMNCFEKNGHEVYIVSPLEKNDGRESELLKDGNISILRCRTGNLFNVGMLEKGISQSLLPFCYERGIEEAFGDVKFDLILYSTPPISLAGIVEKLKRKTGAKTYLLLKDIFPQNAVDIGVLNPFLAKLMFRSKERKLYEISDYIGCMSPANVDFLLKHNQIKREKVEVCPNSIIVKKERASLTEQEKKSIISKYNIHGDKVLFIYGGNLGLPQGIPFIIECIKKASKVQGAHFIVCGNGTEYGKIENFVKMYNPSNLTLINGLPKNEYEKLARASDVGLIFLDHRFTIPNFPSRLLSYMAESLPVLVCADKSTDMGSVAEKNEFGLYSQSISPEDFAENVKKLMDRNLRLRFGENGYRFLLENYTVDNSYRIIMKHFSA